MNTELLVRATFVLDRVTAERLSFIAGRFGRSRSDLVREILAEPVEMMEKLVRSVPDNPTPLDLRQLELSGLEMVEQSIDRHLSGFGG